VSPRVALCCCLLLLACSRGTASPETDAVDDNPHAGRAGAPNGGAPNTNGGASPVSGAATGGTVDLPPLANDTESGVFVHLFEWRWADIAQECERFLGPNGFTAVQVSPPSEHTLLAGYSYPWWQRYQTVSYALESRSGSRAEFVDMVARCRRAGVGIYVDAVLNHMTGQASGSGSAGTKFTKYSYPNLYEAGDFHAPACQIQSADYASSAENVQTCELLGLSDLDTSSAGVQDRLASYLSDLLGVGVRGFRIDAAKHMSASDLSGVLARVRPQGSESPYYFLEVIDYGGEAVRSSDYLDVASQTEIDVTEFRYKAVGDTFLGRAGATLASLAELSATTDTFLPGDRAVVFLDNHDTQRGDALFYQDGAAHELASVFMLAFPYGYPSVMSSFAFDRATDAGRAHGPPSATGSDTQPVYGDAATEPSCAAGPFDATSQGWICEHRRPYVASMVAFRKQAGAAPLSNVWNNGNNQLAFAREGRGFVAINHEAIALEQELATSLPEGTYCDVLSGDFSAGTDEEPAACAGNVVSVDAAGSATLSVPAETALAIHVGAKL
jgi:alpha-amylase